VKDINFCSKFIQYAIYQLYRPSFVEDITKHFGLFFLEHGVYASISVKYTVFPLIRIVMLCF